MSSPKKAVPKYIYLTIVSYIGGQIDKSLKPVVVLNETQFLFAYGEEDKGFVFQEYSTEYNTKFTQDNINRKLGLSRNGDMDASIDALYELGDHGFEDTEAGLGVNKFVKRLTGNTDIPSNKVDPRGGMFS